MIYFIIFVFIVLLSLAYLILKKPVFNYDYDDMIKYNKFVEGTNLKPLSIPKENQLNKLLQIVSSNNDDNYILNYLTQAYEKLIPTQNELDTLTLVLSELLYNKANNMKNPKKAQVIYRASKITKRLAHNLYRRYRIKKPKYSNSKFLQFVD